MGDHTREDVEGLATRASVDVGLRKAKRIIARSSMVVVET
jgi:hypothetical protein